MSSDEFFVSLLSWGGASLIWWRWYAPLVARTRLGTRQLRPLLPWVLPILCHAVVLVVLCTLAADDVRHDPRYVLMYLGLGSCWVGFLQAQTIWVGIGGRDDAVERSNPAAAVAVAGALAGLTLCFAGANVGNGPGWWVVVFCAALASAAWFAAWWIVEAATGVSELVTVGRHRFTALRLAAFLVSCGIVLGRAVAGDWISLGQTVRDFGGLAWSVAGFVAAEVAVARLASPSPFLSGLLPAVAYLVIAVALVAGQGPW